MKIAWKGKRACSRIWKMVVCGFCSAGMLAPWVVPGQATEPPAQKPMTMAEIMAAAKPDDWRAIDPENTLYLELAGGRVVIELAPMFAPRHAANVKALAREKYFDGLAILRVQDNYVVQWGDPNAEDPARARKILDAKRNLPAEFDRVLDEKIPFTPLPDGDVYAEEVGFSYGFPVARDKSSGRMWLVHCYGMAGAGRGDAADSGSGAEIYVVIGHAPRHLDRNVTLFGRVVQGMEVLSSLPRAVRPDGLHREARTIDPHPLCPRRRRRAAGRAQRAGGPAHRQRNVPPADRGPPPPRRGMVPVQARLRGALQRPGPGAGARRTMSCLPGSS